MVKVMTIRHPEVEPGVTKTSRLECVQGALSGKFWGEKFFVPEYFSTRSGRIYKVHRNFESLLRAEGWWSLAARYEQANRSDKSRATILAELREYYARGN